MVGGALTPRDASRECTSPPQAGVPWALLGHDTTIPTLGQAKHGALTSKDVVASLAICPWHPPGGECSREEARRGSPPWPPLNLRVLLVDLLVIC